jgi:indole-3-glycerol phosphate synthase
MILDKIIQSVKKRIKKTKEKIPLSDLIAQIKNNHRENYPFSFQKALSNPDISFICEIKKASPSKGLICANFNYKEIALKYQESGANAVSVLTEPEFFLGSDKYLKEIKEIVKIPVLRKDFIIDAYQIYEAKLLGADAVLLICAVLDFEKLKEFMDIAYSLGISCLVEIHNEKELNLALKAGAKIIGANNRNLKDFSVDFNNSLRLKKLAPPDIIFVSESGIKTAQDINILRQNGVNAVLIGEELMRSNDIKEKLKLLRGY